MQLRPTAGPGPFHLYPIVVHREKTQLPASPAEQPALREASIDSYAQVDASADALAIASETRDFISLNQRGNWLAAQTRPDLSILVSSNQQKMPQPTVGDIRKGNMLARRSQQLSDLGIR